MYHWPSISHLWLDFRLFAILLEPGNVHLTVKVTDIAADTVVTHLQKMLRP